MSFQVSMFPDEPEDDGAVPSFDLGEAGIAFFPDFLTREQGDRFFREFYENTAWQHRTMVMWGKTVPVPRLTAWYGDPHAEYAFSKLNMLRHTWTPTLLDLKEAVEEHSSVNFNSVLLNLYRDGQDSVAWHADDESELGRRPTIASVSLGAVRKFQLRHNVTRARVDLELNHGSLVMMQGPSQQRLQHAIPKTRQKVGPRINLTFRLVRQKMVSEPT